ncbi:MAG: AAA family ATPase, partial [Firmicutes bacterium]|nr:AAA family ATPase [Bacillota bacterium]
TDLNTLKIALEDLQLNLRHTEEILAGQRQQLNRTREDKYQMESQLNQMEAEVKLSQERINNYQERIAAAGLDAEKYAASLEKMEMDLQIKMADFEQQQSDHRSRNDEVAGLSQEISHLEHVIAEQESLFERQSRLVFERVNCEAQIKNEITIREDKIRKTQEKKERLLIRMEENLEQIGIALSQAGELQEQIGRHGQHKLAAEEAIVAVEDQKKALISNLTEFEKEYREISQENLKLEQRLVVLGDLSKNYAGYSEGVKSLFRALDRGQPQLRGIRGLVADLIEVPPGIELAVIIALGKGMENIVVETSEAARRSIQFLQRERLGRATFLPLDILRAQGVPGNLRGKIIAEPGVLGLAADLLTYDREYAKVVKYLMGRVLVVQDLNSGLAIFKKYDYPLRIVSLEGELINANGAMSGGLVTTNKSNPLQRKNEAKNISHHLVEFRQKSLENRAAASALVDKIENVDAEIIQEKKQQAELEFHSNMIRDEELRVQRRIESAILDKERYRLDLAQLETEIYQFGVETQDLQVTHRDMWAENNQINDEISTIKSVLENSRREYAVRNERLRSYQEQLNMKKRELENMARNIAQFEQIKQSYLQSRQEAQALGEGLRQEVIIHQNRISSSEETIADKRQHLQILAQNMGLQQQEEKNVGATIDKLRAEISALQQKVLNRQEQNRVLEMKIVRLETEIEGLQNQWREKYGAANPNGGEYDLSSRQVKELRLRLEPLKSRLELLGSIDIDSIKEYDEIESRHNFLQGQTEDLSAAKISLENLLQETEKIMTHNFAQFISLADASFSRTFVEIFNGGEAGLNIESSDDLAAGVDIVVKMPGKRSQALNLLSGGERALTCIAFIFSLLRLKPAPFCLLDEIDASLDETNLMRFADFLQGMARETQFIVITHRQATIEAGNNIYGITMLQEGVSAVLSLHCDQLEFLAG